MIEKQSINSDYMFHHYCFLPILELLFEKKCIFAPNIKRTNVMLEEDLDILQNLLERKRNYEKCIKNLTPYNGTKVITNYTTGKPEKISARIFASIQRFETQSDVLSTGYLDERSEELLLPIFQQLLEEVQKEIDAVQIGGIPGKESKVKTMYSEEIQPMFRKPKVEEKKNKEEPSVWIKWGVAIGIGILLMLLLSVL